MCCSYLLFLSCQVSFIYIAQNVPQRALWSAQLVQHMTASILRPSVWIRIDFTIKKRNFKRGNYSTGRRSINICEDNTVDFWSQSTVPNALPYNTFEKKDMMFTLITLTEVRVKFYKVLPWRQEKHSKYKIP